VIGPSGFLIGIEIGIEDHADKGFAVSRTTIRPNLPIKLEVLEMASGPVSVALLSYGHLEAQCHLG
jgi:hypothetical protein